MLAFVLSPSASWFLAVWLARELEKRTKWVSVGWVFLTSPLFFGAVDSNRKSWLKVRVVVVVVWGLVCVLVFVMILLGTFALTRLVLFSTVAS